jgi:hypothetical protein
MVSPLSLARIDLKRMSLSAEIQRNWMPRALGPMMLRPGLGMVTTTRNDLPSKDIDFEYTSSDTAIIELTDGAMRVQIDDVIVRRPAVTSKFNRWNGAAFVASSDFASTFIDATDVGYWKDNDESGATSAFASGGYLSLLGTGAASAIRDRSIAVVETGVEHSLQIVVARGSAVLRVGTSEGGDQILADRTIRAGNHSFGVTPPGGTMYVRLSNSRDNATLIDSVTLGQAAADMVVPTPWAAADLQYIRTVRINDVTFVACKGIQQKRIERQGADSPRSWSVVEYAPEDGPFRDLNTTPTRLRGSALTGDITLEADRAFFTQGHVGALFKLPSAGQEVTRNMTSDNVFTDPIRVTGVGSGRTFNVAISGTFSGSTVTAQRSVAEPGDWVDIFPYTAPVTGPSTDGLDNQIIYYRLGIKAGDYVPGDNITATLTYSAGSISGIVRVTGVANGTTASASVLRALGRASQYTQDWQEGDWSPRRGYPSAVSEHDGRLHWQGKGMEWGSVPDQLDSFDPTVEGDSAPIRRTLGDGAVDIVNWSLSANNLLLGLESVVKVARSSSIDEPLTQTRFGLKPIGDVGTCFVPAVRVDTSAVYVGGNESRVYESALDEASANYGPPGDLTALVPEIGNTGFVRRAFQRFPDRRLHFVRGDGTAAVLVLDKLENVTCWVEVETPGGFIEDVVVLRGAPGSRREDRVYYTVRRTIDGQTKRFRERWATEVQGQGAADTRLADCHIVGTATAATTLSGLSHLDGETVCLWGNGKDLGTYKVDAGSITPDETLNGPWCAGLPYKARYKSSKRAVQEWQAVMLTMRKKIDAIGLVLAYSHYQGLKYGPSFDDGDMDDLPLVEHGAKTPEGTIWQELDTDPFTFPGRWGTDPRLCLEAASPRPCTVMGLAMVEQAE